MMVVFAHANEQFPSGIHLRLRDFGVSGVDLFFVISGFVMTYTAATHRYGRAGFVLRRVARIVPLYWLMTLITAVLAANVPTLFKTTTFGWTYLLASLCFIPFPAPITHITHPLLHLGWTLNYEMFFYVCFAVLLTVSAWRRLAVLTVIFGGVVGLAAMFPHNDQLSFYGDTIIFEFVFGSAIAVGFIQGWYDTLPAALTVPAIAGGAILLVAGTGTSLPRALACGIPAALVVLGCVAVERRFVVQSALFHRLGDATYSVYLTHIYIVMGLRKLWLGFHLPQDGTAV